MPFLASAALFMVLLVAVTAFTISNESMSFFVHADWGKGGYDGSHYSRMLAQENNGNNEQERDEEHGEGEEEGRNEQDHDKDDNN